MTGRDRFPAYRKGPQAVQRWTAGKRANLTEQGRVMRFAVDRNWIEIVGKIWWPMGPLFAQRKDLTAYDMKNIGKPTRRNVEAWLATNAGDFSEIVDFRAIIGEKEIGWKKEENGFVYSDCQEGGE